MLRKYSIGKMAEFGSVLYIIGVVLTILREHLKELPVIIACPIGMYFKLFLTTRNGLFQSLASAITYHSIPSINTPINPSSNPSSPPP